MVDHMSYGKQSKRIFLSPPELSGHESRYIREALESNYIAPIGPQLDEFERRLADLSGVRHALAVNSGTAAIHLALMVLGVGQGDEVICSTFTFAGSCNPIRYCGATPVFVDSESRTWNMDADALESAILDRTKITGKKPKAIIVVHLYGMPAEMDRIMSVARTHGIPVVEDAAEALGSTYRGRPAGGLADLGVYSFNGNKIITTSGGGALLSDNEHWIARARFLSTQARESEVHYEHREVGYNYRMSNISAALGLGQLDDLESRVQRRRRVFDDYRQMLGAAVEFQPEPEGSISNRWLTAVLLPGSVTPRSLVSKMEQHNIETRPLWKPMHLQPVYQDFPYYGDRLSDRLFACGVCLPSVSEPAATLVKEVLEVK